MHSLNKLINKKNIPTNCKKIIGPSEKPIWHNIKSWHKPYPDPPCDMSYRIARGYARIRRIQKRIVNTSILNKNIF